MKHPVLALFLSSIIGFLLTSHVSTAQENSCPRELFGSDCQYKCHCSTPSCSSDGTCTSGGKCKLGWFGPACQYADLVMNSSVSLTPDSISGGWVFDGDDGTCNEDTGLQTVTINLTTTIFFTWMRIVIKDHGSQAPISIQFNLIDSGGNLQNCVNQRKSEISDKTVDIYCEVISNVRQIIVSGEGVKSLCSVHISGDSGSTIQPPYWLLEFREPHIVYRYAVYNRDGRNGERLKGFTLESFDEEINSIFIYHDDLSNYQKVYKFLNTVPEFPVMRVNISLTTGVKILTLCEVEIYGDCMKDSYGLACDQQCSQNCGGDGSCQLFGNCLFGCKPGYQGSKCSNTCSEGWYGDKCSEQCSGNCVSDEPCYHVNGTCLSGCKAGFTGHLCISNKTCTQGWYGLGCKKRCSKNCAGDGDCNSVDGTCLSGCKAGYKGHLCNEICVHKTYGPGCKLNCSQFCQTDEMTEPSVCYHTTGFCLLGCLDGYEGLDCTTESTSKDDQGLNIGIGISVAVVIVLVIVIVIIVMRRRVALNSGRTNGNTDYDGASSYTQDNHNYNEAYVDSDGYNLPREDGNNSAGNTDYENADLHPYDYITNNQIPERNDRCEVTSPAEKEDGKNKKLHETLEMTEGEVNSAYQN